MIYYSVQLFLFQTQFLNGSFFDVFWNQNTIIAKSIICIIIFLLICTIYLFFRNRKRIKIEFTNLNRLKKNLNDWKGDENITIEEDQSSDTDEVVIFEASIDEHLLPNIKAGTIVHDRLKILQHLRGTKSKVNISTLQQMSELNDAKNFSSQFPAYVMSLSMLLGILGTFIGLTIMIGEISSQLQGFDAIQSGSSGLESFKSSFKSIRGVMSGVGTAFTTTLTGLVCTITVSVLNFSQNRHKAVFFDQFEQFTLNELLPHTFPDLEQEEVINAIKDQMEDTFRSLNGTIEKNSAVLGTIDSLYEKFGSMIDVVKNAVAKDGTGELQGTLEEMHSVNENLEKIIDKYENRKLLEDFERVADKYDQYLKKHDFVLEQSKWLPNARIFMIAIVAGLLSISVILTLILLK